MHYNIKYLGPAILGSYVLFAQIGKSSAIQETLPIAIVACLLSIGQGISLAVASSKKNRGLNRNTYQPWLTLTTLCFAISWVAFTAIWFKTFSLWPFSLTLPSTTGIQK